MPERLPEQLPPVLSLYRVGDGYALRLYDQSHTGLAVVVSKGLPPDAKFLQIITPTDMKLFQLNASAGSAKTTHAPAAEDEIDEGDSAGLMPPDPMEEVRRLAATADADSTMASVSEVVGETPQGTKVVRRKKQSAGGAPAAGSDAACGRCRGTGQIQTLMEGGQAATVGCPVCQGSGQVKRYGAKR